VNKVFLSGKIGRAPEVAYTPKGRKIVMFPMVVDEGDFSIDVVGAGDDFPSRLDSSVGGSILVAGELVGAKLKSRDVLRLKASKILWMEG
jgi:primosomal replication protein N